MILFALPLIATALLQTLFNTADLAVVGQFAGSLATAAVGATSSVISLIVSLFMGLSTGVCVLAAQAYGAQDNERVQRAAHTALIVGVIAGVLVAVIGIACTDALLAWMDTPAEVIEGASLYMKIYFLGVPGMLVYNFCAAIFRAVGDSKRPLYILTAAGVVNVILNLIFVICFGMAEDGVAAATAISQTGAAIAVIWMLSRKQCPWRLQMKLMRVDGFMLRHIIRIGLPAGVQGSLFSISNVVIQSAVNSLGAAAVSACAACNTIENYVFFATSQFNQTAVTFVGQSVGARDTKKVGRIVGICIACVTAISVVLGGLTIVFREPLLQIFIPDSPEAVALGAQRLILMSATFIFCAYMDVLGGGLRGLGVSISQTIVTTLCIIGTRFIWVYLVFPTHHTLLELFISYPISWVLSSALLLPIFLRAKRKFNKSVALEQAG